MIPVDQKHAVNEERRAECGVVAQGLLNAISHRVLRTIVRHLVAAVSLLTGELLSCPHKLT